MVTSKKATLMAHRFGSPRVGIPQNIARDNPSHLLRKKLLTVLYKRNIEAIH